MHARTWTTQDDYILACCAGQGLAALSYALGRKPSEIISRAREKGVEVADSPITREGYPVIENQPSADDIAVLRESVEVEYCPKCGSGIVLPWTSCGRLYGICPSCHFKALSEASEDVAEHLRAKRGYNRLRRAENRLRCDEKPEEGHRQFVSKRDIAYKRKTVSDAVPANA